MKFSIKEFFIKYDQIRNFLWCSDFTYRGVFTILSNIFDATFCENSYIIDLWKGPTYNWAKVLKSGLSKFCRRQPLKNLLSPLLNTLSQL